MVGLIWIKMLDTVKQKIKRLIAAYEAERMERIRLQDALDKAQAQNETYRKQITELERQIDNLKLAEAFKASGAGSPEAKKKINSLMKEIDRCISLLEG
jgi:predicted  nucleic acid-binding Zn-ribbon protein